MQLLIIMVTLVSEHMTKAEAHIQLHCSSWYISSHLSRPLLWFVNLNLWNLYYALLTGS